MSYTPLEAKDVKAAKEHRCEWCFEAILRGEVHNIRKGIYDGDFQSTRFHLECVKPCMVVCKRDEGFTPGEGERPGKEAP